MLGAELRSGGMEIAGNVGEELIETSNADDGMVLTTGTLGDTGLGSRDGTRSEIQGENEMLNAIIVIEIDEDGSVKAAGCFEEDEDTPVVV